MNYVDTIAGVALTTWCRRGDRQVWRVRQAGQADHVAEFSAGPGASMADLFDLARAAMEGAEFARGAAAS